MPRALRHRPGGRGRRAPGGGRPTPIGWSRPRAILRRARPGEAQRGERRAPTIPTRRGGALPVLRRALKASSAPRRSSPRSRTRSCAAWAGRASRRGRSGSWPRRRPVEPKYAICNADESEPGTFKDRQVLAEQPHLVLEGMLLGMVATGAEEGWVFIRHEYGPEEAVLREELAPRASPGSWARTRSGPAGASRSTSSPPRVATSWARRRRCSSAWRATAASRATSRRSPASTASGASRRS